MKEVISIANCKKYSKKIYKEDKINFGNDYSDDPQLDIMCKAFMEINNKRECLAFIRECPEPFMKKIGKGSIHVKNEVTVRVKYIIMDDFFRNKFVRFYENEDSYNEFKLLNIITGHRTYIEIIDECLECIGMKEVI